MSRGSDNLRLWRIPLRSEIAPEAALLLISQRRWPFALVGRWAGGGAILGCDPLEVAGPEHDPFALLDRLPEAPRRQGVPVGGGWFGWLGYGIGRRIEDLPPQPPRDRPLPDFHLAYYDHLLRRDATGRWWFEALATAGRERALERKLAHLTECLGRPLPRLDPTPPPPFRPVAPGVPGHIAAVGRCLEKVRGGELFQANIRLRLATTWNGDLAGLFARTARALRPSYGAAFIAPWGGLVSLSPELFLRRRGRSVETAPIKGTARRPVGRAEATAALARLRGSAKDAAENVMTVDVARNDLGRVCALGSIEAAPTPCPEEHPGVWHLVSRVSGRLSAGVGDGDLIRAAFPPASVTGAPKIQAMRAIAELEPFGREVYTGAIGYLSPFAGLELSVAIRAFELHGDRIWLDVGGGIVADSTPERELDECIAKAAPLVAAAGSTIEMPRDRSPASFCHTGAPTAPPPAQRGGRRRPDPAHGLLETVLVREGRPHHLDEHLTRLTRSLDVLYGVPPRSGLREQLVSSAAPLRNGALRVRVRADGDWRIVAAMLPRRTSPVPLHPVTLAGGLGAHKWADRRLLDSLDPGGETSLLVDSDGSVLEAAWGNIWAAEGSSLLTPPADGRILPGVMRSSILKDGVPRFRCFEAVIDLERLARADAVFLSSSLAGLVPAVLARPAAGAEESGL